MVVQIFIINFKPNTSNNRNGTYIYEKQKKKLRKHGTHNTEGEKEKEQPEYIQLF